MVDFKDGGNCSEFLHDLMVSAYFHNQWYYINSINVVTSTSEKKTAVMRGKTIPFGNYLKNCFGREHYGARKPGPVQDNSTTSRRLLVYLPMKRSHM